MPHLRPLLCMATLVLAPSLMAADGTYLSLGGTQMTLGGKQAGGKGGGFVFRTMSYPDRGPNSSFWGGIGVDLKSAYVTNEDRDCCFAVDEKIHVTTFGLNAQLLWPLGDLGLGVEVGVHRLDLEQTVDENEIAANYGTTKFGAVAHWRVAPKWSIDGIYEYYMPIEEKSGDETYDLRISALALTVGYYLEP